VKLGWEPVEYTTTTQPKGKRRRITKKKNETKKKPAEGNIKKEKEIAAG